MEKPRILLVDDIEDNLFLLEEAISELLPACEVARASSGHEALGLATGQPFSCILLDMHMPVMDGIEVTRRLREHEATVHVPVILITAHKSTPAFRAHALDAGADEFVAKPISNIELVARVKVMLRVKRAEDKLKEAHDRLEALLEERTDALSESEERYRTLFDETGNPVLVIDTEGAFIDANNAACRFMGCSRDALLAKNLGDFGHEGETDRLERYLKQWDAGGSVEMEFVVGGQTKVLDIMASSARWQDRRVIFGVGSDVTQRRRAEREALKTSEDEETHLGHELSGAVAPALGELTGAAEELAESLHAEGLAQAGKAENLAARAKRLEAQVSALARALSTDILKSGGLAEALQTLAADIRSATGMDCRAEVCETTRLDELVAAQAYRIARDAVRAAVNAGAQQVRVALSHEAGSLTLSVTDQGAEESLEQEAQRNAALRAMKLRAGVIGASLSAQWNPCGGTTVVCALA